RDWRDEYGGHLELWNRDMTTAVHRITPIFNRCVIFSTTSFAYHGHPEPLQSPENVTRKSIALYYYTRDRPSEEVRSPHTTLFQRRPGESRLPTRASVKQTMKRFVPPIVGDMTRARKNKR